MNLHARVVTGRRWRRVATAVAAMALTAIALLVVAIVLFLLVALTSTLAAHNSGWARLPFLRVLGHTVP